MLAWHVACNSVVTYSNYARCELRDAIELGYGDVNLLQACPRS